MNSLVSIVIPTFNRAVQVCEAIRSAQDQSYRDLEIIVVDDGSSDETANRVAALADQDPRIHYVHQSNRGPAAARNAGIAIAKGEYVAFLDSDDLWLPQKLELQMPIFRASSVAMVYSSCWVQNSRGERDEEWTALLKPDGNRRPEDVLFKHPRFLTPSTVIKREVLLKIGIFDESLRYYEDIDLWFRAILFYSAEFLEEELVIVRKRYPRAADEDASLPVVEVLECVCRMRERAVALYEKNVRSLTIPEKRIALQQFKIQYVKELLANNKMASARAAIRTGWDLRMWPQAPVYYLLTLVPGDLVSRLIRAQRKRMS